MSVRGFLRAFLRSGRAARSHGAGGPQGVANDVREGMGAQGGGALGGRITGSAIYRYFEDRKGS